MKFNLTLINPVQYKFGYLLTDACRAIAYGLRSLGHRCDLTLNTFEGSAINIVVGTHLLTEQDAAAIVGSKVKYIAFQSEWLYPGPGTPAVTSSFHGDRFEPVCRSFFEHAEAIWEPYAENARLLARFDIAAERIKLLRILGYHPDLVDVRHRDWANKDIDVLFFGSLTPRRNKILTELAARARVVSILDATSEFRNDLIARAKINLNLHADDKYSHLSIARACYLLNNRCALVSENATTHTDLQTLMLCDRYDRLVSRCMEALTGETLTTLSNSSFERFQQMPMTEILQPLL